MVKIACYLLVLQCALQVTGGISPENLSTRVTIYDTNGQPYLMTEGNLGVSGPSLGPAGVMGRLVIAEGDLFACNSEMTTMVLGQETIMLKTDGVRPIVLMERSPPDIDMCTFEQKVLAVQAAGAAGAIIFDYVEEGPIVMAYEHDSVNIPAIIVSKSSGEALLALAINGAEPLILLTPQVMSPGFNSSSQLEFVSFSTGYLLLLLISLPVGAVTMVSAVRRRRKLEHIYTIILKNAQARTMLAALLPADYMLPKPRHQVPQNFCRILQKFLMLVFVCYLFQMLFYAGHLPLSTMHSGASQSDDLSEALYYGSMVFFTSLLMATAALCFSACLCTLWKCITTLSERVKLYLAGDTRTDVSVQISYVPLSANKAPEACLVHQGQPIDCPPVGMHTDLRV